MKTLPQLPFLVGLKLRIFNWLGKTNPDLQVLIFPKMWEEKRVFDLKRTVALNKVNKEIHRNIIERSRQGHNIRVDRIKRMKKERKLNPVKRKIVQEVLIYPAEQEYGCYKTTKSIDGGSTHAYARPVESNYALVWCRYFKGKNSFSIREISGVRL